jgi:acetyltransferase-like isoleucine patch superfamily enzyme
MRPFLASVFDGGSQGISIAQDSTIGVDVHLGNHVTIYPKVELGNGCVVMDGAVLGRMPITNSNTTRPIHSQYQPLLIGDGAIIGCNAVLYTGTSIGRRVLIADLASIREGCAIGDGVVIGRGVMVLYECQIGDRSRIQDQVHLVGNMVIEEDVFIGMGVTTTNDNDVYLTRFGLARPNLRGPIIRRYAVVGAGATILPGVEIGEGAMVAAGAVVTRNIAPWTIAAGVPARHLKEIPQQWREQILQLRKESPDADADTSMRLARPAIAGSEGAPL